MGEARRAWFLVLTREISRDEENRCRREVNGRSDRPKANATGSRDLFESVRAECGGEDSECADEGA
jgi:hypothetical protein